MLKRTSRKGGRPGTSIRLYYASDVHGSDLCWRKFLNAAKFYEVPTLIMGGDLCGKGLAPVVRTNGGWTMPIAGEERHVETEEELEKLEKLVSHSGLYPRRMTQSEFDRISGDESALHHMFEAAIVEGMRAWMELADERLQESGAEAYVMPGNDDPWAIDGVLAGRRHVVACDDSITRIGEHELLSLGWANETPWHTPRELAEDALYNRIKRLAEQLDHAASAIFNIHVPPYASGLDTATELDETLKPVLVGGQPHEIPVGSTAVRQLIEEYQPALGLHGHIHESRGIISIGRTVCINPGSAYGTGRIEGVVVELEGDRVRNKHLVSG
jgi:Icc-related predicted phosphoesterase